MHPRRTIVWAVSLAVGSPAIAQSPATKPTNPTEPVQLAPLVVTANPLGSELFDLAPPYPC